MIKSNLFKKSCVAVSLFSYLVSSTFAAIPTMTVEYDAAGNVAKQTAGNGQAHNYGYDIAGNVVSYSSPGVGSTSFEYGPESLSKFTDFKGLNTTYQIDKLTGQVESVTSPDTGTTSFTYDQAGNVVSALTPAGVTFSFTYDALNRPLSASFGDETVNYSYYSYGTAKGELASIQDSTGSTGFNYNAQGLPLSKTQTTTGAGGGSGASLGYLKTWAAGQLSSLRYPSGKTISYTYDAERITSISLNGTVIISNITYSANGAPVSWQMGGTGTYSRSYDSYGRMVSYSIDGTAKAVGWDENNRVSSIDYASGTSSFGYDAADRLTSASGGPHAGSGYAYDANGNKTSVTVAGANYGATVDPSSNRILTFTAPGVARSYSYDNKGNTVGDGTRTYSWSNTNKLLSATNGTTTAYYGYNGFGQRVKKVVGQAARYYFYDDDGYSLLGEYFQTTPGAPVGTVYETVYLEGIPVAVLKGSSVYYIQPDHLNTPRIIRDASGVLVWKWDSDLYGKGLTNQNPGGVSLFEFNIRFPGQVFDAETGLHYNMARYYDPEIGRYTSSDPIGLGGGINTYEYVAGNPTGAVDPEGTLFFVVIGAAIRLAPVVFKVARAAYIWYNNSRVIGALENLSTAIDVYSSVMAMASGPCVTSSSSGLLATAGGIGFLSKKSKKAPIHHICTNKSCVRPPDQSIANNSTGLTKTDPVTGKPLSLTEHFKEYFDNAGLDMDGPENKVSVPNHFGPHPPEYHGYVAKSLKDAVTGIPPHTQEYTNAVKSTLSKIANEAVTVNSKVNKWLTIKR